MIFASGVVLSLILASVRLVGAQTNSTGLEIEAIEAHFTQSGIVPSLLPIFDPSALMSLAYTGAGDISPGQALTQDQVSPTPSLTLTPANSSVQLGGNYTLIMADAGPVGTDESQGQTRHWLVNGVTLNGTAPLNIATKTGTAITKYAGPAPAQGSGAHRYVILLYIQPENFTAPDGLNTPDVGVSVFNLQDYVSTSGLGPVVAATYFTVENGAPSVTPSATSAVVTSTLPVVQSSSSGSISGFPSAGAAAPSGSPNAAGITVASAQNALLAAFLGFFFL